MIKIKMLLVAVSLWTVGSAASSQQSDVFALLRAAHADAQTRILDKFAASTVNEGNSGSEFRVSIPFGNGNTTVDKIVGSAIYTYEDGHLRLLLSPDRKYVNRQPQDVFVIERKRKPGTPYAGANAFGAVARVSVIYQFEDALAMLSGPKGELSPYIGKDDVWAREHMPKDTYWTEISLAGPEARKMALDAQVVIEGSLTKLPMGRLTECSSSYAAPRVGAPKEVFGQTCWAGAIVSKILFVSRTTGTVIKQWSLTP